MFDIKPQSSEVQNWAKENAAARRPGGSSNINAICALSAGKVGQSPLNGVKCEAREGSPVHSHGLEKKGEYGKEVPWVLSLGCTVRIPPRTTQSACVLKLSGRPWAHTCKFPHGLLIQDRPWWQLVLFVPPHLQNKSCEWSASFLVCILEGLTDLYFALGCWEG